MYVRRSVFEIEICPSHRAMENLYLIAYGKARNLIWMFCSQVFSTLYGKHAVHLVLIILSSLFFLTASCCVHQAALYAQAADFNKTARFYYMKAQDAYYLANAQVIYIL